MHGGRRRLPNFVQPCCIVLGFIARQRALHSLSSVIKNGPRDRRSNRLEHSDRSTIHRATVRKLEAVATRSAATVRRNGYAGELHPFRWSLFLHTTRNSLRLQHALALSRAAELPPTAAAPVVATSSWPAARATCCCAARPAGGPQPLASGPARARRAPGRSLRAEPLLLCAAQGA